MSASTSRSRRFDGVRERLRQRGLRWTGPRRTLVGVLAATDGHVTAAELIDRCRREDPATVPSTVYRTLDVLEELGLVRHGHGADGREEYHVLPAVQHGHLHCSSCGVTIDVGRRAAARIRDAVSTADGFEVDVEHVTLVGRCRECAART